MLDLTDNIGPRDNADHHAIAVANNRHVPDAVRQQRCRLCQPPIVNDDEETPINRRQQALYPDHDGFHQMEIETNSRAHRSSNAAITFPDEGRPSFAILQAVAPTINRPPDPGGGFC